MPPRYYHKVVEKLWQSSQLHTKGLYGRIKLFTPLQSHIYEKWKKRKNISHYFFGDERNSDSVSQAPPHQIGLVKLSPSCHDHKRYMHWQKHLNQHRPQVSSWSLHQLARSNKKSHLFHYELGVHTSVKSSTIFLWPHVLVLGSVITLKYNVEHPDWFCGFRTQGGQGCARLLSGGHFHADWYFWASTSFSLILERPPLSPSLVSANQLSTEQWGSSFLCYTLELGPIDIIVD